MNPKNSAGERLPARAVPNDPCKSTLQFYEAHAEDYFDRTVLADLSPLYDAFLKHVRPGGRILDVGCGSGRDLKNFRARGFDPIGVDASHALIKKAAEFSGVMCLPMKFEEIDFDRCFDAVWACASLLHIPKSTIFSILQRLNRALVKDGALFVSVQIGEGEKVSADGRYFVYYTPDELAAVLTKSGFSVTEIWVSTDSLADREPIRWVNIIAHSTARITNPVVSNSKLVLGS